MMSILQINQDFSNPEISLLVTQYLSNPCDVTFHNLSKKLIGTGEFTDIIFSLCLSTNLNATSLKHC